MKTLKFDISIAPPLRDYYVASNKDGQPIGGDVHTNYLEGNLTIYI